MDIGNANYFMVSSEKKSRFPVAHADTKCRTCPAYNELPLNRFR